jgi:hypothetical protein
MYGETMVHIMTINLIVKTRLVGIRVGGSGLKRIKEKKKINKAHHILNTSPPLPLHNIMCNHLVLTWPPWFFLASTYWASHKIGEAMVWMHFSNFPC